ncbi:MULTISPECIES: LLM class flavin-dependent oxidoreductase [Chryseobacterium]|uniref:Luciferase-like monooxygenase n=1 Tax=Chryseobacterium indoltheticum TaxID=254 RepID=A0A381FBP1_9FLAO|nr:MULTISPECIES: LLM class flavin-dependent oxidoreductase [Chryseobacterium]AZA73739.1 LLM class flavin-dependent oxidoreductase [Chryseobacterium indoltheticum]SIQ93452.1 luciferase family oxidoreductase, group 1 [Chryseobacterium indoltheticum]SUX43888.1 Alkanal monooxygenase alpha chain [Chryseobacterium indoltheticum]
MKNISYSILELAIVSQNSSYKETLNNSLRLAQVAEEHNYIRYWFAEHHNSESVGSSATSVLIGYVAENTDKIKVGSGGIMLPNHSPLIISEQFGTLAQLYPGRIDLGLGRAPGTDTPTAMAIRSDFMKAAHSFPDEVNKIQKYFSTDNKSSSIRTPIAEGTGVPVYILGSSTDSAHLAAQKGLPYAFASHFASANLISALHIYREEFQASESLDQPYIMAGVNIIMANTDEEAERLFTSLVRMFFGVLTGNSQPLHPPTEMTDDLKDIIKHPSLHQMLKYSFVGSKEKVKRELLDFIDQTNIDELMTVSTIFDIEDRLKSIHLFAELMDEINLDRK